MVLLKMIWRLSPYKFLYDSYLKLIKNKHKFRGKSQQWDITLKLPTFFHQTYFPARFLYVVHKTGKKVKVQHEY